MTSTQDRAVAMMAEIVAAMPAEPDTVTLRINPYLYRDLYFLNIAEHGVVFSDRVTGGKRYTWLLPLPDMKSVLPYPLHVQRDPKIQGWALEPISADVPSRLRPSFSA